MSHTHTNTRTHNCLSIQLHTRALMLYVPTVWNQQHMLVNQPASQTCKITHGHKMRASERALLHSLTYMTTHSHSHSHTYKILFGIDEIDPWKMSINVYPYESEYMAARKSIWRQTHTHTHILQQTYEKKPNTNHKNSNSTQSSNERKTYKSRSLCK